MEAWIKIKNLKKCFPITEGLLPWRRCTRFVHAVDGIGFEMSSNQVLALVGESGCGKTTTGKLISLLEFPNEGSITFEEKDVTSLRGRELRTFRRNVQMIFQDPYASLNPRSTVYDTVREGLAIHHIGSSRDETRRMVYDMLQRVELSPPEEFSRKYPHMLSGGERQRVAIARAMILRPKLVVADEPVSMLDASIRAGVMDLMLKLKRELQTTYLFITHDLSVARYMSDKILVMYCGKLVEQGPTEKVISNPQHPYTKILLSAVSIPDPSLKRQRVAASGEPMSNVDPPSGCRFSPRCSYVRGVCHKGDPQLVEIGKDHSVACPFAGREE